MSILILGAKVVDSSSPYHLETVDVFMEQGKVSKIGKGLTEQADQTVSVADLHISMGWTDIFADYREPGFEHKETIASGLAAAAAGGYTSVFTTPNTNPTVSSKSVVQYLLKQAENQAVALLPLGSISHNIEGHKLAEMLDMQANGAVAFTDGWQPIQNANLMLKALEYVKSFQGTLIQIPLDTNLSKGGLMHEGVESTQLGMPGIPSLAESLLLYRDIELLRYTDSKLHVTGISCAGSVAMIRQAKEEGLQISCSVTPYHLLFNDEILRSYNATYKVMPPIRTEQDRLALLEGLKEGVIDCIASHHRPQDWDAKAKEFEYAADGMNLQELSFLTLNSLLLSQGFSATQIVAALSTRANEIFGLKKAGLKEGVVADFTLFSFSGNTQINALKSRAQNHPFKNTQCSGSVVGIVKNDQLILN